MTSVERLESLVLRFEQAAAALSSSPVAPPVQVPISSTEHLRRLWTWIDDNRARFVDGETKPKDPIGVWRQRECRCVRSSVLSDWFVQARLDRRALLRDWITLGLVVTADTRSARPTRLGNGSRAPIVRCICFDLAAVEAALGRLS